MRLRLPSPLALILLHLLLSLSVAFFWQSVQAQPSPIEEIHQRALQQNYPDLTRTDSDTNRAHVLLVLKDAATYEGPYGGLVDAIAAEPHYKSPSKRARQVSAGSVAHRLQVYYEAISAGGRINKQAISNLLTEWKAEVEGFENAVLLGRVPAHMSAVEFAIWQMGLK